MNFLTKIQKILLPLLLLGTLSCSYLAEPSTDEPNLITKEEILDTLLNLEDASTQNLVEKTPDSLYKLEFEGEENIVEITAPLNSNFSLYDEEEEIYAEAFEDFNGDGKEDIMVYLGACGTGGCVYGVFLNQYDNYYKLVFNDYLKGADFEKAENGSLLITSYEEVEAYDPSKLYVYTFRFNLESYYYELDTNYIYYDTLGY